MTGFFESWSDALFFRAWVDSGQITKEALDLWFWDCLKDAFKVALADPMNWRRVHLRRDARSRAGAARVTRALRRAKPGQLVRF